MTYQGRGTVQGNDQLNWTGTFWNLVKKPLSQVQSLTATGAWDGVADVIYVTGAGAKTITLPLPGSLPRRVSIVDSANAADVNPITVVAAGGGFINGRTSFVISKPGGSTTFILTSVSGSGSWQVESAGPILARVVVVWRPSSTVTALNVFSTFAAVLLAAKSIPGRSTIILDSTDSSTFSVPAGAHDFEGRVTLDVPGSQTITFALNASFNNVLEIRCSGALTLDDGATADTNNSILRITTPNLNPTYENLVDLGTNVRRFIRVTTGQGVATERKVTLSGSSVFTRASVVECDGALRMTYQGLGPHTIFAGSFFDTGGHAQALNVDIESPINVLARSSIDDNWTGSVTVRYRFTGSRLFPSVFSSNSTLEGTHGRDIYAEANSTGGAFQLTLPLVADTRVGDIVVVKDVGGLAGTNNITIHGNGVGIDGVATLVLTVNFQSARLRRNSGGTWSVI